MATRRWMGLFALALMTAACAEEQTTPASSGVCPTCAGPAEKTYCSTTTSYSSGIVTITGSATYQARQVFDLGATQGLGNASSAQPIRRAEVVVTNSSGSTVQCAETDGSGNFSLILPQSSSSFKVYVNSRSYNSYLRASVLNSPDKNQHYSLTINFTPNSSQNIGTLNAGVTGEILGGAFNILDQMLKANDYLRAQVANCSGSIAGCDNFSVNPKVQAYWKKGFDPGSYYNADPLSYYLPGYSRLFILGGENGDVDSSDTDHFDNSVIIHEYGHFLEDTMFASDSPGGSHNGNRVIDPRLAWSEGWGNFFQAAVRNEPNYIDTIGTIDGVTDFLFNVSLEVASHSNKDIPDYLGEGNFREFSVTRFLWDVIDSNADTANSATDSVSNGFPQIWASLTKTTNGWMDSVVAFRDIGMLHVSQSELSLDNWSSPRAVELQRGDRSDYAQYVTTGVTCANNSFTIVPQYTAGQSGDYSSSDQFSDNDFYHYRHSTTGTATFTLDYQTATSNTADLDLVIYNEDYTFASSTDIRGYAANSVSTCNTSTKTETVTISNLPAGDYLINVHVYTGISGNPCRPSGTVTGPVTTYTLKVGGTRLCRSSVF